MNFSMGSATNAKMDNFSMDSFVINAKEAHILKPGLMNPNQTLSLILALNVQQGTHCSINLK